MESTDLYLFETNGPGMARQVSTTATTETSSSTSSNVQTTSTTSSTSPAVIGGAVGGALGAIIIALVVLLVFILTRRRTKRKDANDGNGQSTKAELEGQGLAVETQHHRHDKISTSERDKSGLPPELAGRAMGRVDSSRA